MTVGLSNLLRCGIWLVYPCVFAVAGSLLARPLGSPLPLRAPCVARARADARTLYRSRTALSGVTVGRDAQGATKETRRRDSRGEARGRAEGIPRAKRAAKRAQRGVRRETRCRRRVDSGGEAQARRGVSGANDDVSRRASPFEPREEVARRPEGATRGREEPTRCPRVAMRAHACGRSRADCSQARRDAQDLSPSLI